MRVIIHNGGAVGLGIDEMEDGDGIEQAMNQELSLDDSAFDVYGWVSIEVGGVSIAEVHVTDLYPAVKAFNDKYINDLKTDKLRG